MMKCKYWFFFLDLFLVRVGFLRMSKVGKFSNMRGMRDGFCGLSCDGLEDIEYLLVFFRKKTVHFFLSSGRILKGKKERFGRDGSFIPDNAADGRLQRRSAWAQGRDA